MGLEAPVNTRNRVKKPAAMILRYHRSRQHTNRRP